MDSQGPGLKIDRVEISGGVLIRLKGDICERLDPRDLASKARGTMVLDLDQVHQVTSSGVRNWIQALKMMECDYLAFANCRPQVVIQFNSVAGFAGKGELISFYAPYTCPSCGHYDEVLTDLRKDHARVKMFQSAKVSCSACQAASEFDDLPETYFYYAGRKAAPVPPPLAQRLLDGGEQPRALFRAQKEVEGSLTVLWLSGPLDQSAHLKRLAQGLERTVLVMGQGLQQVAPAGIERLRSVTDRPELSVYLARVPPELALGLAPVSPRAQLVSVQFPFRCSVCQNIQVEEMEHSMLASGTDPSCSVCRGKLVAQVDPSLRAQLVALSWSRAPQEVRTYLKAHLEVPRFDVPQQGETELGRYELLERIGSGGMAEVFLAVRSGAGGFSKRVVLKRILPHYASEPSFVDMFLQEARLAAQLSHPNVVQTFDVGQDGSSYFICMEYIPGRDLGHLLRTAAKTGRVPPMPVVVRILADVCAGLQSAHLYKDAQGTARTIIHRDVSPQNILLSTDGLVKLSDFGIAKSTAGGSEVRTMSIKGKLLYMAPEALDGVTSLDARVDLFAVGAVLYEALTLRNPFQRLTQAATIRALCEEPLQPPSRLRPDIPSELENVILKALARSREERYASAFHLQQDLENVLRQLGGNVGAAEIGDWVLAMTQSEAETPSESPQAAATSQETVPGIRPKIADCL